MKALVFKRHSPDGSHEHATVTKQKYTIDERDSHRSAENRNHHGHNQSLEDARRLSKNKTQLVNKWLALQRRTNSSPTIACLAGFDAKGNYMGQQDRVIGQPGLPIDPRLWSPHDVKIWLHHMTQTYSFDADPTFFQMNGRGLCLMSLKGFLYRVPNQGILLFEDFRKRLKEFLTSNGNEARRLDELKTPPLERKRVMIMKRPITRRLASPPTHNTL